MMPLNRNEKLFSTPEFLLETKFGGFGSFCPKQKQSF